ncbi:MAG: phospholipase effector Tle1 domain-containing protein [Marinobacter sp.]|uniref:phospholipase effector Tle1 domain-containing protein n=1 Tax=Marinobacter sp. TaxID=50741 RepID=UPI003F9D1B4D
MPVHACFNNLDMEIRHFQAEQKRYAESEAGSKLNQPLGIVTHIAPIPSPTKPSAPTPLKVVTGLFLDGTLNNVDNVQAYLKRVDDECVAPLHDNPEKLKECQTKLRLMLGESYANGPTNVVKLFDLYQERNIPKGTDSTVILKAYEPGAGTKTGASDSLEGMATGLGDTGVPAQVQRIFSEIASQIMLAISRSPTYQLTIDLFGFSRGAAAARHAANEILKGQAGQLGQALAAQQVGWPQSISIRFLGLFDTVAGIVNLSTLDFSPGNNRNSPVQLYVDPNKIEHAAHLVAQHEKRANFALDSIKNTDGSLPSNFREITLPGAHSDIGGGYHDVQTEDVLLHPSLDIRGSSTRWPHQTMEWDNLKALEKQIKSEGWIGEYSLPLPNGSPPTLALEEKRSAHPSPDGKVTLSLRMTRQIKGEYSRIALRLMYLLAGNAGVPLKQIPVNKGLDIPENLNPAYLHFRNEVTVNMNDCPELPSPLASVVKQRYTHHSDHYNLLEGLLFNQITKLEFPFDSLAPFRSFSSRERTAYPNREPE